MNQPEAAAALGCTTGMVSRLRSGERRPSVRMMMEVKRLLSWSLDDQAAALERGDWAAQFTGRMDRRRVRRRMRRGRAEC